MLGNLPVRFGGGRLEKGCFCKQYLAGRLPYPEDTLANDEALNQGGRLFSAYGQGQERFWVITEADRSITTVLLTEDY